MQPQVNKVYQLFARGRWFSSGTPLSSTTKTGLHDIAENGVKHKIIQSNRLKTIFKGIWNESLNSDGQQFYYHQHNHWTKKDHDIWR